MTDLHGLQTKIFLANVTKQTLKSTLNSLAIVHQMDIHCIPLITNPTLFQSPQYIKRTLLQNKKKLESPFATIFFLSLQCFVFELIIGLHFWKRRPNNNFFIFIAIEKFEMLIRISIQSLPTSQWSLNRI